MSNWDEAKRAEYLKAWREIDDAVQAFRRSGAAMGGAARKYLDAMEKRCERLRREM